MIGIIPAQLRDGLVQHEFYQSSRWLITKLSFETTGYGLKIFSGIFSGGTIDKILFVM
ncbi:MAG: hypothetical protein GY870_03645 [archaeon]|nr:hypothetical protein [archaeon]